VLRFLTTADTEILAASAARRRLADDFPELRCANPAGAPDLQELLAGARVVLCRVLGGRRGWPGGIDELKARCDASGLVLIALGGEAEPDAEMTALSSAPAGAVAAAGEYLRHGDIDNVEQLLRFLSDTFLLSGYGFEPPHEVPDLGVYRDHVVDPRRPTVGVCFYRSHHLTGNTAFVDALCAALEDAGANALAVWSYTLRRDERGRVPALELLDGRVDALITTMLATGGSGAADEWDASALAALDVPVIQAATSTQSRATWEASASGLSPLDAATQVAIPEFDGRLLGGVISFKERDAQGMPIGYLADPERCARVARLAVRFARLRHLPAGERRVAVLLTSFPTRHAKVGMAVGLDTPASALALLDALAADGMDVERPFAHGDELMHALIGAGGHDPEFLTDEQLASAPLRLGVGEYLAWYATLPGALRSAVEAQWGPPPGDRYEGGAAGREAGEPGPPSSLYVDGEDFVIAGLALGNVLIAIQPPRGYGEDPLEYEGGAAGRRPASRAPRSAIYHDPELPPTHHYLAVYRWIDARWGADAIVHLGKHGTLEWLPGKVLALGPGCAPDAALGDVPLVYPFVVNDPGEGVQAKRRAHAVIVDHLVPAMMRADTYDELAELETLLDDYARLEVLDPPKLPALAARIWSAIERANLQGELGVSERPDDLGELVGHIDGYLCEVKDIQIKDGLHILGRAPQGEQLRGLTSALLRLGSGGRLGLRQAVGAAFGLDEPALVRAPGAPAPPGDVGALLERFPGPGASAGDLVDRLEQAQAALLEALASRGWAFDGAVCEQVLGRADRDVQEVLRFAAEEVVPLLARTDGELAAVVAALRGRHVPAGPSGAPTRGRLDVLPTGRNFYSVDPRALPSELAWEVGQRLADALIDKHGSAPEMVGLVAWGTSAMRTGGDDVAEMLALLGARPVWDRESRRVRGVEAIPLAELGRPRIDVTVRISGFFRDAFPHLVALLDDAVRMVASLEEPDDQNFVAKHVRADSASLAGELAATRVFGSAPGTYGAGLSQLIEARGWRDEGDLASVYEAWGGYAYGRGVTGASASEAMRACYSRIEVAVKNVDSREHDILDSDDYYQYHGGMVAMVRSLRGSDPAAYMGDSSDPSRVISRTLGEETRRVFRARVANPRWIASMIRHGYKGAAELSATVDYLFGYDATAGVADDWMYETVAERYLLDADIAEFMARSNPWAGRAIAERLLEAADRGLWGSPSEETLGAIREQFLALEGELEDAAGWPARPADGASSARGGGGS
jgi:cobaltochelatase CobN